jgi:ATP-dependent Lhr-like helicase
VPVDPLELFHAPTRAWLAEALGPPTPAQALGWPEIARGATTLLLAPTGSGKTLAAFLAAIDRLMWTPPPRRESRCRVLYVSPLKALAVDVERNLRAPLAGIHAVAERMGMVVHVPSAFVRTGDTPSKDRARMRRFPPDILITTPESLFLVITSGARELLRSVDTVIVDEIHSLVANKRGAHLFLSLERLEEIREGRTPLQRIGLSATQKPLNEVARLLAGFEGKGACRPVVILDASAPKLARVRVEAPDVDMSKLDGTSAAPPRRGRGQSEREVEGGRSEGKTGEKGESRRSIWPYLHEHIVRLVRAHQSTMIFVNSRRLAERLASALNELAGEELALAHHGAVAKDQRALIEDRLKRGELRAIVATSSLELGIDMGAVDLVVQVESPPSVASGLQRIGRAGHSVGQTSVGILLPKHRGDLLACAAVVARMRAGEVESTFYPRNPLDVLAQQIVAIASDGVIGQDELFALVRRAAPFAELSRGAFEGVLDMLSGRYAAGDFAGLRARITWDRVKGQVKGREGAKRVAIANGGTIPDRGLFGVFLAERSDGTSDRSGPRGSRRVGELDEEMVFELRAGDVFLLGASSWRTEAIIEDRVLVSPAPGEPGKMPFWHGDRAGRPLAFGQAIGALARELLEQEPLAARSRLAIAHGMNESAASNLLAYLSDQREAEDEVPSDRTLIIERLLGPTGDYRVCLLSPLGARVHAPWCTAVLERLSRERDLKPDAIWSDDGLVFRMPEASEAPPSEWFLPPSSEVERLVTAALGHSSVFASRFRECASRALLLPRRRPGQRTPLWTQRRRAADLLAAASGYPEFPILLETYRECLCDVFDMAGLIETLRRIESGQLRVVVKDSVSPSPFASSLLFSFVASFIYEGDAPLAERRAQALTIDHERLRELMGEVELRSLLDPTVLEEYVRQLSGSEWAVGHADGLHDLLLAVGDLSLSEIASRSDGDGAAFIRELVDSGRVLPFEVFGEVRYGAIEDAGRLRDALGVVPPRETPSAFLEHGADALGDLLTRYARTHGPFTIADVSTRFGLDEGVACAALLALVASGRIVSGEFLRQGRTTEYVSVEVLQALRQKSLARLRRSVEPVLGGVYARFLVQWQLPPPGVDRGVASRFDHAPVNTETRHRLSPNALLDVIRQLEGCPLLASEFEDEILSTRVPGYRPWDLDSLCASGEVVWGGIEPVGAHDGRIALYLAEHEATLARPVARATGAVAERIRGLLNQRGAIFFSEIARALGGFPAELQAGLWELVWSGEATNDTLEVLRGKLTAKVNGPRRRRSGPVAPAGGRWSLRQARWRTLPSVTDKRAALARTLLDRYGVVGRESAEAEGLPGGFSEVYDVLKAMEEAGRIRRGYFVAPMGATQFAVPGAVDRLRALRDPARLGRTIVLAATDPANAYGAALPWPSSKASGSGDLGIGTGPQRAGGTLVVLHDGELIGWLGRRGDALLTFVDPGKEGYAHLATRLAEALAGLVDKGRRKVLLLRSIDGAPPKESPLHEALVAAGFSPGARGLHRRRSTSHGAGADGEAPTPPKDGLTTTREHVVPSE